MTRTLATDRVIYATDTTWRDEAACFDHADPLIFFEPDRYKEARAVCAFCKVTEACRQYGNQLRAPGIWGGLDQDQRGITAEGRICVGCKEWLDRSEFWRDRDNQSGLKSHCRECIRARRAE